MAERRIELILTARIIADAVTLMIEEIARIAA
jgi:hypothetical protein